MKAYYYILFIVSFSLLIQCKKKDNEVENPYDNVDYGSTSNQSISSDKYSLTSIHDEILSLKCGTPGCHDGSFEPNFSSMMSSYSTLVYHSINKNNAEESFKYRVVPYKPSESVLYERITNCCFVNTNDRMPQDNIGVGLPQEDIERIKKWIEDGAKDFTGHTPNQPNNKPVFQWYYAIVDEGFPNVFNTKVLSANDNRVNNEGYGSMIVDTNMGVVMIIDVQDDETAKKDLQNGRLLFSYDQNDFSNPIETNISKYLNFDEGSWYNQFSTSDFISDSTVYMRYYINDGVNTSDTEGPEQLSPSWFKNYWSFIIIPGSNQ